MLRNMGAAPLRNEVAVWRRHGAHQGEVARSCSELRWSHTHSRSYARHQPLTCSDFGASSVSRLDGDGRIVPLQVCRGQGFIHRPARDRGRRRPLPAVTRHGQRTSEALFIIVRLIEETQALPSPRVEAMMSAPCALPATSA